MSEAEAANNQQAGPQFGVQKTFLKDLSFEMPMGVKIFTQQGFQPKVKLDVNTSGQAIAENTHEIILRLTITSSTDDGTAYLIEVQQAAIFSIAGFPEDQLKHVLGAVCPNYLFPYAREVVDSTIVRAGFPPLNLAPIDFDAMYRQSQAAQGQENPTLN